jgi:hypothetical protein
MRRFGKNVGQGMPWSGLWTTLGRDRKEENRRQLTAVKDSVGQYRTVIQISPGTTRAALNPGTESDYSGVLVCRRPGGVAEKSTSGMAAKALSDCNRQCPWLLSDLSGPRAGHLVTIIITRAITAGQQGVAWPGHGPGDFTTTGHRPEGRDRHPARPQQHGRQAA